LPLGYHREVAIFASPIYPYDLWQIAVKNFPEMPSYAAFLKQLKKQSETS
jgi:hypothetical protein